MGFTTGVTGGVTVTLSLAYLAVLTHRHNRQSQADILHAQSHVLNGLLPASPAAAAAAGPGSAAAIAAEQHTGFSETAKRRWNSELEGAVRWAQTTDWVGVRESAEGAVGRLLWGARADDGGQRKTTGGAEDAVRGEAEAAGRVVREAVGGVGRGARNALEETKAKSAVAADTMHVKAEEAKAAVTRGVEKGKEKGKDMVGKAKATIGLAEERFESKVDRKLLHLSEVEKALNQRYEKSDVMDKSVEEVLSERYKPIGQRDNITLRGV